MLLFLLACPAPDAEPDSVTCDDEDGAEVQLTIRPYLQWVHDGSATVMWETDAGTGGSATSGDQKVCAERVPPLPGGDPDAAETQVWMATLDLTDAEGVQSVVVQTGSSAFDPMAFELPTDGDFRFVALSDSQMDTRQPDRFGQIVASIEAQPDVDFVLMPGDLVDNGWRVVEWQDDLFAPAADLLARAPLYPAIGNHEGGSPLYFRYFHLPGGLDEHTYAFDRENVRVLTLDSNGWQEDAQLDWLDAELDEACTDPELDFVFAQLHHPWLSELWTPGNTDFTGEVVQRLEAFSSACDKPTIHFFGHTHGYSRGQSRDHDHVMINVASAGGRLDRWGEHDQADYAEFSVSQDHYGYVLVDVQTGEDPQFTLTRISQGTPDTPLDDAVTDTLTIWRYNAPPATPTPVGCMEGSPFSDPDGHAHQGTHWQTGAACDALDVDIWTQDRNEFDGVDTQAGDDLTDHAPDGVGCFRLRYRDEGLVWSEWSAPSEC